MPKSDDTISFDDFMKVDIRVGRIVKAEPYPEARRPGHKVWVDFGPEIGELKSSAQITVHYEPEALAGKLVMGVVNFPDKQIGKFRSEFLLLGFADDEGAIVLAAPDKAAPAGARLS